MPQSQRKPITAADAGAEGPASGTASSDASGGTAAPPSHIDVNRVLAPVLAHKLLTIPSDFFTYEYLYKNHTRHFHAERNGGVTGGWVGQMRPARVIAHLRTTACSRV